MAVAYVLDEVFAGHRPPSAHPERPERFLAVRAALADARLAERGQRLPVRAATLDEMGRVHTPAYLDDLTKRVPGNSGWLDPDTYYSPGSWQAVEDAAGAAVDLTRAVLDGRASRGLAVVRPPGHHAEADRAMGFCLVNNVAVAAAAARDAGAGRVAILDWDVHHGNGTQHIFESDPTVMYLSCHQYPFYPGSGSPREIGVGEGTGSTVNVALAAGAGDPEYRAVMQAVFAPALRRFRPDLVLLSAGFDAHAADPLASMRVDRAGYRALAEMLVGLADELCDGRLVAVLEGGYDLDGLSGGVVELFDAMDAPGVAPIELDDPAASLASIAPSTRAAIEATLAAHAEVKA